MNSDFTRAGCASVAGAVASNRAGASTKVQKQEAFMGVREDGRKADRAVNGYPLVLLRVQHWPSATVALAA